MKTRTDSVTIFGILQRLPRRYLAEEAGATTGGFSGLGAPTELV